jgi:hypothetical protein
MFSRTRKILNAIPDTLPALLAQHVNSVTPALIDRGRPMSFSELAGVAGGVLRLRNWAPSRYR